MVVPLAVTLPLKVCQVVAEVPSCCLISVAEPYTTLVSELHLTVAMEVLAGALIEPVIW